MSASDNVHPDQFVRVFHRSYSETPVHKLRDKQKGDTIFAGTRKSSEERGPWYPFTHVYDIPKSMIRPELWGDDMMRLDEGPLGIKSGEQPELWETLPADPSLADEHTAIQFRNAVEDKGSISHIFHKDAVKSGNVRYVGTEGDQPRSKFGKIQIFHRGTL